MSKYLKLIRANHYIKNLLIFAALVYSGQLFDVNKLSMGIVGFVAFCALCSVIYIINDICDREKDRKHPTKCTRPIASGAVSVRAAWILAGVLFLIVIGCSFFTRNILAAVLLLCYFLLNLVYSLGLKNVPILDIAILVSGFLIRILYGAVLTGIEVSHWLYLTVMVFSFYLAFGKRKNEIRMSVEGETRPVLTAYSMNFLDKSMNMCVTLVNAFYALWSVDEKPTADYNSKYLILTVPLVILITIKYSLSIEGDSDGDPVNVLLHDKVLLLLCLIYGAAMMAILYL